MGRRLWSLAAGAMLSAGCGGDSSSSPSTTVPASTTVSTANTAPGAVMSAAQLVEWEADALAFAARFNANFSDAAAVFAEFTDDMVIYDPANGDTIEGKPASIAAWTGFAAGWPDVEATATGVYVSTDAAAFTTEVSNLAELPGGGPLHEIRLYRFHEDRATVFDLWYQVRDVRSGCLAVDGCWVDPARLADSYLAAWSTNDPALITALYRQDATLVDGVLGIAATGAFAVADSREQRFGSGVQLECAVLDLYAQTDGGEPPTASRPDQGQVVAVAIVYRCTITGSGAPVTLDLISALWLAARGDDGSFDVDPEGLVLREEVFHDTASLIAAGFAS